MIYIYLSTFFLSFLITLLIVIFDNQDKSIANIQSTHESPTSRLGGVTLFSIFSIFYLLNIFNSKQIFSLSEFILIILFSIIVFYEDINQNLNSYLRLVIIAVFGYFIYINNIFYEIVFNFPFGDFVLNNKYLVFFFYLISFSAVINGLNFIDGVNGNFFFTILSIYTNLYLVSSNNLSPIIVALIICISAIFIFNWPFGKIFFGDTGCYLSGILSSLILIKIFNLNNNFEIFLYIIIFLYPLSEVSYSIVRKIFTKKNPFKPDKSHVHINLFYILKSFTNNTLIANSMTSIVMLIFSFSPFLIFYFFKNSVHLYLILIFLYFFIYSLFNVFVSFLTKVVKG